MATFAIVLSGCGVMDGSEIHEAVACMLALERAGMTYQCVAPNMPQTQVIDHILNEKMTETRNVLVESARIARGNILDMATIVSGDFAGAIYPGGFGCVLNLCDFFLAGADHHVQSDVLNFAQAMAKANKPQGFACIAPALIAKIYGPGVAMTIGSDLATAEAMVAMGNDHHCVVNATDIIIDAKHKVVSTAAYMSASNIAEVFDGIDKMVRAVVAFT